MRKNLVILWENYQNYSSKEDLISFISGRPGEEVFNFPQKLIREYLIKTSKSDINKIVDYSPVDGIDDLKKVLVKKYFQEGISINKSNIFITSGSQQAIDLFLKSFLKSKEKILMARENYIGLQKSIENCQAQIVTLSKNINEITADELESVFEKNRIKIFYIAPDFANPNGLTINLDKRKTIAKLAKKYQFQIIEDQAYRDLVYLSENQLPSLKKIYPQTNVIGSVSKTIVPGLRIGWLITNGGNHDEIYIQKRAADLQTPYLNQAVIAKFMNNSDYFQKYLKSIRKYYQEKMEVLLISLKRFMPIGFSWNQPNGGFFVWVEGPKKLDSRILFKKALKNGVAIMPGFVFSYEKPQYNNFRLSISNVHKNKIEEGVKKLGKSLK